MRTKILIASGILSLGLVCGCAKTDSAAPRLPPTDRPVTTRAASPSEGRLGARPVATAGDLIKPGQHQLNIDPNASRDALIYVPQSYDPKKPAPLVVFFHGNRGTALMGVDNFRDQADRTGAIFLFPESKKRTWDRVIDNEFGPDLLFVDQALRVVFKSLSIDPTRIAAGGFSDGGTYALSLGLNNGDLFTHIIAYSPGGTEPVSQIGRPAVFLMHGVNDDILPIDECSRVIAPQLIKDGYQVSYREFDGKHQMTHDGKTMGIDWFLK